MAHHVGHRLAQAPGQRGLGVRVERARQQGEIGVVLRRDPGRLEGGAGGDDLHRQRRPPVAADRLPDVVQGLPADRPDLLDLVAGAVPVGTGRQPAEQPQGELGLERDHRERLPGQVVHVPRQPQPLLAGGQPGHRLARLRQLAGQLEVVAEPDHGQAEQHRRQQVDEEVAQVDVADHAGDAVACADQGEHPDGGPLDRNRQAGDGRHVEPERGRARAPVEHAGGQGQREQRAEPDRRASAGRVPVRQRDHEDHAERRDDGQPAADVERVVVVAEQARYRLDEVDQPDRGEGHAPQARAPRQLAGGAPRVGIGRCHVATAGSGHGQIASAAFLTANVASPTKTASQIRMMLTGIHETVP